MCTLTGAVGGNENTPPPTKVILDVDCSGLLPKGLDVDDDLVALSLVGLGIDLLGITTTYGNAAGADAFQNGLLLRELLGKPDLPVLRGGDWNQSAALSTPTPASEFIARTILSEPARSVVIMAFGPLLSVAAALVQHPEIEDRVQQLVLMGGDLNANAWFHIDMNWIIGSRQASQIVLASNIPKLAVTVQACVQVAWTSAHTTELVQENCPSLPESIGSLPASKELVLHKAVCEFVPKLKAHPKSWVHKAVDWSLTGAPYYVPKSPQAADGFFPWDLLAMAAWVWPNHFEDFGAYNCTAARFVTRMDRLNDHALNKLGWDASRRAFDASGSLRARRLQAHRHIVVVPRHVNEELVLEKLLSVVSQVEHPATLGSYRQRALDLQRDSARSSVSPRSGLWVMIGAMLTGQRIAAMGVVAVAGAMTYRWWRVRNGVFV